MSRLFAPPALWEEPDHGPDGWTADDAFRALAEDDPHRRSLAVHALAALAGEDPTLLAHVRRALQDEALVVRAAAACALAERGDASGVDVLAEALGERALRYEALQAARRVGAEALRGRIARILHGWFTPGFDRLQAAAALASWGDREAARYVLARARKPRALDRGLALELCAELRLTGAYEACAAALEEGPSSLVRGTAALALGRLGDRRAKPLLQALAEDVDEEMRADAMEALRMLEHG